MASGCDGRNEVNTMTENDLYEALSRFEAGLPTDCNSCERIHKLQEYVSDIVDRFDRRCDGDGRCDSRCVACGTAETG